VFVARSFSQAFPLREEPRSTDMVRRAWFRAWIHFLLSVPEAKRFAPSERIHLVWRASPSAFARWAF